MDGQCHLPSTSDRNGRFLPLVCSLVRFTFACTEIKKDGNFKLDGMKLEKKAASPSRKGINPFTKKPCVFKVKPSFKTVMATCHEENEGVIELECQWTSLDSRLLDVTFQDSRLLDVNRFLSEAFLA